MSMFVARSPVCGVILKNTIRGSAHIVTMEHSNTPLHACVVTQIVIHNCLFEITKEIPYCTSSREYNAVIKAFYLNADPQMNIINLGPLCVCICHSESPRNRIHYT